MQVTMPPAVRAWLPDRIGFATAVYTNGLLIGEIVPVALMLPLVLPMVGGSWQWGFVAWSVPVIIITVLVLLLAPPPPQHVNGSVTARRRWWPDWRDTLIWRLGIMLGTINATISRPTPSYPITCGAMGRASGSARRCPDSMPARYRPRSCYSPSPAGWSARRGPMSFAGCFAWWRLAASFRHRRLDRGRRHRAGFRRRSDPDPGAGAAAFVKPPDDVHRVTAAMFTISYSCAVIVPVISGMAWDLSGVASLAFAPIAACGILLVILAPAINHVRPIGS